MVDFRVDRMFKIVSNWLMTRVLCWLPNLESCKKHNLYGMEFMFVISFLIWTFFHIEDPFDLFFSIIYLCSSDIRTFEVLLRTYEVKEVKLGSSKGNSEGDSVASLPCKRRQRSSEESVHRQENCSSNLVMARPSSEARGHTGYLTFARLRCFWY